VCLCWHRRGTVALAANQLRFPQSWLDSESTYRLTVEKAKEATEGATFARNEYEKWSNAWKDAKKALAETLKRHDIDRAALADERKLIKMIMRMIGKMLHHHTVFLLELAHLLPKSMQCWGAVPADRSAFRVRFGI
jgi:hypothetical protein